MTDKLKRVIIDYDEVLNKDNWVFTDTDILIPVDQLSDGDKITLVFDEKKDNENVASLISIFNKEKYKNLTLESEVEFVKSNTDYDQNLELIVRGINIRNKRFIIDEYYAFGINKSKAYLAKVSYHQELDKNEDRSFSYKELLNLSGDPETPRYFLELSEDQQKDLNLDNIFYRYNTKYKFLLKIEDDLASLSVEARSPIESMDLEPQYIDLFKDININQGKKEISRRNTTFDSIISSNEPIEPIKGEGLYGFSVPNSFVKLYRVQVNPLDEKKPILYDRETYSKEITTDFSITYRNNEILKLNSNDSRRENGSQSIEIFDVKNDIVPLKEIINKEDISLVQINDLEMKKEEHYTDKFLDIIEPMNKDHEGSRIEMMVDKDHLDVYGQRCEHFEIGLGDGLKQTFVIPDEAIEKIFKYPNGKIGDFFVEIEDKYIINTLGSVGLREDSRNFITKDILTDLFSGRKFYLQTEFRGQEDYFDMGTIIQDKLTFDLQPIFNRINDSYDAVWKYNLSNFTDLFLSENSILKQIASSDLGPFETSKLSIFDLNDINRLNLKDTFGYILSINLEQDVINLIRSNIDPVVFNNQEPLPSLIQDISSRGMDKSHIQAILIMFFEREDVYRDIFIDAISRTNNLRVRLSDVSSTFVALISGNSEDYNDYLNFRDFWIRDFNFNIHSDHGINKRRFYSSVNPDEFTVDPENSEVKFSFIPKTNKKIMMRVFYNTQESITDDYQVEPTLYDVSSTIKDLYTSTNGEKGSILLTEKYNPNEISVMRESDNMFFVVVPNKLFNNGDPLFADMTICSPFIENEDPVRRKIRAPLVRISDLLTKENITKTRIGDEYKPSNIKEESQIKGNRENDFIDYDIEINEGDWYLYAPHQSILTSTPSFSGDFPSPLIFNHDNPRLYPHPLESTLLPSLSGNIPILDKTWSEVDNTDTRGFKDSFYQNLFQNTVEDNLLEQYLKVEDWYNIDDTILVPFHQKVLDKIVNIKSKNRVFGERTFGQDPLDIDNWFDGFYTGELTPWVDTWKSNSDIPITTGFDFGRMSGSPFGTQNSRQQMFDQLSDTINNKFEDYTLFYIDLTQYTYYNKYALNGLQSSFIDPMVYPLSGNERIIDNPYIDPDLKKYIPFKDTTDVDGRLLFKSNDFRDFTNKSFEYPKETRESFLDISDITYDIEHIIRELVNGEDLLWGFNTSIIFDEKVIQNNVEVNVEFEYSMEPIGRPINDPYITTQQTNIGTMNGSRLQKYPNPDVFFRDNIEKSKVRKVWLDNYKVTDTFDLVLEGTQSKIMLNSPNPDSISKVGVVYNTSNTLKNKTFNLFKDDFDETRDFKYTTMTRTRFGYAKLPNIYKGYIIDKSIRDNENFYRKDTMTQDISGNTIIRTGGTTQSKSVVRGIDFGLPNEDVIELMDIRRNNNFELSVDILFDAEIERNLMNAGLIFRGGFKLLDDDNYLNEFYMLTMNFEDNNISLISKRYNDKDILESCFLATVSDLSSIILRNTVYTLRLKLIHNTIEVFLNERNQKEKFFFSYNLKTGQNSTVLEETVSGLSGGLGVDFREPEFELTGDRIGLFTRSDKTYFTNFKMKSFEESNIILSDTFKVNNMKGLISTLKKTFNIIGDFTKIRKTVNGYTYIQIGNTLVYKRGDESYSSHRLDVTNFEVLDKYVYVHEKEQESSRRVLNLYKGLMEIQHDFIVDGKSFIDEPVLAYLNDLSREVEIMEEKEGSLFIKTRVI